MTLQHALELLLIERRRTFIREQYLLPTVAHRHRNLINTEYTDVASLSNFLHSLEQLHAVENHITKNPI